MEIGPVPTEALAMSLVFPADPIPLRMDTAGDVRVGDSRVLLDLVVRAFEEGATPETIVQRYTTLRLEDVYAVIAYYLRHRADVEEYLRRREERAEAVRKKIQAEQGDMTGIRERLLARRAQTDNGHAPTRQ